MGNTARLRRVVRAGRLALAVMLVSGAVAAAGVLVIALSRRTTLADAWAEVAGAYPAQALVGIVVGTATLLLLLVFRPPAALWGLGWRSALAGYTGVIAAALSLLLAAEWMPGQPGAAGGPGVVIVAILGFTLVGGPLWMGLIAVLLSRTPLGDDRQLRPLSARQRGRLGTVLIIGGLSVAALTTAGTYATVVHDGVDHSCMVEGPFSPLAEVSERPDAVRGSFSLWPLGRQCTWVAADGTGTVTAGPGWANSMFAAAALGVAATGIGLRASRRRTATVLGESPA